MSGERTLTIDMPRDFIVSTKPWQRPDGHSISVLRLFGTSGGIMLECQSQCDCGKGHKFFVYCSLDGFDPITCDDCLKKESAELGR